MPWCPKCKNEYKDGYYYDICYWRKCSCIRDSILNNIFNEYNSAGGIFENIIND